MGLRAVTMACLFFTVLLAEMTNVTISTSENEEVEIRTTPIFPRIPMDQTKNRFQVLVSVEATKVKPLHTHIILVHNIRDKMLVTPVNKAIDNIKKQKDIELSIQEESSFLSDRTNVPLSNSLRNAIEILNGKEAGGAGIIILLTDAKDINTNEVRGLVENTRHTVHILGLGADHDARALHAIASASIGGTYSSIHRQDKSPDEISEALAMYVGVFKNVVVPGTSMVKLEPHHGIHIEEIDSGVYKSNPKFEESVFREIKIGMLQARETKKFIVHLRVNASAVAEQLDACGKGKLLTARFLPHTGDTVQEISQSVVRVEIPPPGVNVLPNVPSPLVVQNIVRFKLMNRVKDTLFKGEYAATTEKLVHELQTVWEEFEQEHQFWSGLGIDVLLGDLKHEINVMVKHVQESSSGAAYIYSWISSYEAQRPTALGSLDKFLAMLQTEEVKFMAKMRTGKLFSSLCNCPKPCFPKSEVEALKMQLKETLESVVSEKWQTLDSMTECEHATQPLPELA